jgi:hypothetical protein
VEEADDADDEDPVLRLPGVWTTAFREGTFAGFLVLLTNLGDTNLFVG